MVIEATAKVRLRKGGALTVLENLLSAHGFVCQRLIFKDQDTPDVENLFARIGTENVSVEQPEPAAPDRWWRPDQPPRPPGPERSA